MTPLMNRGIAVMCIDMFEPLMSYRYGTHRDIFALEVDMFKQFLMLKVMLSYIIRNPSNQDL